MAAAPQPPETRGAGDSGPATPRWVKVFAVIALALLVLFVVVHLAGGGMGGHLP